MMSLVGQATRSCNGRTEMYNQCICVFMVENLHGLISSGEEAATCINCGVS